MVLWFPTLRWLVEYIYNFVRTRAELIRTGYWAPFATTKVLTFGHKDAFSRQNSRAEQRNSATKYDSFSPFPTPPNNICGGCFQRTLSIIYYSQSRRLQNGQHTEPFTVNLKLWARSNYSVHKSIFNEDHENESQSVELQWEEIERLLT